MHDLDSSDFYERLGVAQSSSSREIRTAYLALVRQYTPERAPERFKRLREAYETLSNPSARMEYDTRPDPYVAGLLDTASQAMRLEDYSTAEQAYKQVLLESPDLQWVRNLLGLCFLYQEEPEKAIGQYERLIHQGNVDPAVHGNAAHAYRLVERFTDAEQEFDAAIRLAGDHGEEYGLALVQMWVEVGNLEKADAVAKREGGSVPAGSNAAFEYSGKRVELAVIRKHSAHIPMLLARHAEAAVSEEQKRYAAFVLGKVASRLILGQAFESASIVARAAVNLQPDDPDYDGQRQASAFLAANDFGSVSQLLKTHVSFAMDGWLHPLRGAIEAYCTKNAVFEGMRPISSPPSMSTINGIGTALYGHRDEDPGTGTYVATLYFVLLFVPIFPISSYRVRPAAGGGWYFLGKVPFGQSQVVHGVLSAVILAAIVWGVIASPDNGGETYNSNATRPTGSALEDHNVSNPIAIYAGEVVNLSLRSPVRSTIKFAFYDWENLPNGEVQIYPPLGGSGPCGLVTRGDSLLLASISGSGDTIVWRGIRHGSAVSGTYSIIGGQYADQHGSWRVSLVQGQEIPPTVNAQGIR